MATTQLSADLPSSSSDNQPWAIGLFVTFGHTANAGFDPAISFATKGEVAINNTMTAIAESNPNTIAFIAKKDFKIVPHVDTNVPEPTTAVLLTVALGLCGTIRRR